MSVALLLLPDFILIASGVLLRRVRGFDSAFWGGVERLVYFVLFPALLFRSLARAPLTFGEAWPLVAVGLGFTLAGMALSALARPLLRLPTATFASCFQCGFRFNTYVALAVASRLAGDAGLATMSVLVGVLVPFVNVAAVAVLARGRDIHFAIVLAKNPLVLACVAGFAWQATGLALPPLAAHLLELVSSAALPLGLFAVGAGLSLARGTLPVAALAWWNGVKLVAVPAVALVLARWAQLPPVEREVAVVLAAVPTATSAYILATQMSGHGAPVAVLISSGTLLAAVTLPVWIALLGVTIGM